MLLVLLLLALILTTSAWPRGHLCVCVCVCWVCARVRVPLCQKERFQRMRLSATQLAFFLGFETIPSPLLSTHRLP